jgi:translocation and assembly module TamB
MSSDLPHDPQHDPKPQSGRHRRHVAYAVVATILLGCAIFAALYGYIASKRFSARMQTAVIATLERATGGRVEIKDFHWSAIHLRVQVDGLTIHGLEAADQIPYFHVDSIEIDARILSFFTPRIGLSRLRAERPVFHLIVYPDGSTNQPHPRTQSQNSSLVQTLFDLAVDRTQVQDGLILINNRKIPFDLAAGKLGLLLRYVVATGHYQASLAVRDLTFRLQNAKESRSVLFADIDIAPKATNITRLEWNTASSKLILTGSLENYAHPVWSGTVQGQADLREVGALIGYDPLRNGIADLHLRGAGRADGEFSLDGSFSVQHGAFDVPWLQLQQVALQSRLHIDNTTLMLSQFTSDLHGQGHVNGRMELTHWLPSPPPAPPIKKRYWFHAKKKFVAPKPQPLQAVLEATVVDLSTPLVMAAVTPSRFGDIGFSSRVTGPVRATWHGPGNALDVHGDLTFRPQRNAPRGAIPVSGSVKADYLGDTARLVFQQADMFTPGTEVHAAGTLTLLPNDLQSAMHGTVTVQNLREFDRLIYVIFYTWPNSSAAEVRGPSFADYSTLPVSLQGKAYFRGKFSGSLMEPQVDGHVDMQRFLTQLHGFTSGPVVTFPAHPIHPLQWDSLHADVHYTLPEIDIHRAVVARGSTLLHADMRLRPVPMGQDVYDFKAQSGLVANVRVTNASIADLQSIVGTGYPVTGTASVNAQVRGTIENLSGSGNLTLTGLNAYGQPIAYASSPLSISGHRVQADHILVRTANGTAEGEFSYDDVSHAMQGSLSGKQFDLAQIPFLQTKRGSIGGTGGFHLQAAGTTGNPVATGSVAIHHVTWNGQPMGQAQVEADLQGKTVSLTSSAQLLQAHLEAAGQMQLTPGLPAQLKLKCTDFNIHPVLQMFSSAGMIDTSSIGGEVQMQGLLEQPRQMRAEANLDHFSVTVNDIPLAAEEPVRASMRAGVLELQPVHIQGTDTDLTMQGTAQLFGKQRLHMQAEGKINAALAKTFSSDLNASGQIDFIADIGGTVPKPELSGRAQVHNLDVHAQDVTNGLSGMNGTLTFDQDRLVIQQLKGYTGGGKVEITGFATFSNGVFFDIAAHAKDARIRYPKGVTSTANVDVNLSGSSDALLLRGDVTLNRFEISQNVDIAALAAASQSISAPPDPTSWLNRVRLDMQLTSSPQLGFQNSFATLAGDVHLHIRGTLANPSVLGRLDITQGKANFAGTQYVLQRGDILFANPVAIDPEVNLEATTRVQDYDIIIGLNGPASKLQVNYRSEPPLSQPDVLALLTLGRTNEQAAMYGEQQQAGSNPTEEALLGGALNAAVSNRVQRLFGVASVRVDPNFVGVLGQSTARVTVEQQVGRNITLTFATNVNTTAQQLLQAEYDFTRNLSIIAVRDEADVFSLYFQIRGKRF